MFKSKGLGLARLKYDILQQTSDNQLNINTN
jgi:hypothetical protein